MTMIVSKKESVLRGMWGFLHAHFWVLLFKHLYTAQRGRDRRALRFCR